MAADVPVRQEVRGSVAVPGTACSSNEPAVPRFRSTSGTTGTPSTTASGTPCRERPPSAAATIGRPTAPLTVIVREAGDLLADEPDNALATLVSILGDIADDGGGEPRLLLVLDDTPDRLSHLERRMAAAGC